MSPPRMSRLAVPVSLSALAFVLLTTLAFASSALSAAATSVVETEKDAALIARRLVRDTGIGTMATVVGRNTGGDLGGYPFALVEIFADDCPSTGNPLLLMMPLQHNYQNARKDNWRASLAVRQLPAINETFAALEKPRMNLFGKIVHIEDDELERVQECFLRQHPEAKDWVPGMSHDFWYYRFMVQDIYFVGGFGGMHYIGYVDKDLYLSQNLNDDDSYRYPVRNRKWRVQYEHWRVEYEP